MIPTLIIIIAHFMDVGSISLYHNNYIYASDMQYGLFVFEFDNINAGWLNINVLTENNSSEGYLKSHLNDKILYAKSKFLLWLPIRFASI